MIFCGCNEHCHTLFHTFCVGIFIVSEPVMKEAKPPHPVPLESHAPSVVDSGAMSALRAEIQELKATTVSKMAYEALQQDLNATRASLEAFKKDTLKKLLDLMKEVRSRNYCKISNKSRSRTVLHTPDPLFSTGLELRFSALAGFKLCTTTPSDMSSPVKH